MHARAHTLCVYILQPYANVFCLCKHEKNVGRDFFPHTSEGLVTINFDLERPLVDLVDSHKTSYFFNRDGPAWALAFSKAGFRPKRIRAGGRTNFKVKFISLRGVAVISVCVCVFVYVLFLRLSALAIAIAIDSVYICCSNQGTIAFLNAAHLTNLPFHVSWYFNNCTTLKFILIPIPVFCHLHHVHPIC